MKSLLSLALVTALAAVALLPAGAEAGPIIYRSGAWDRWVGGREWDNYGRGYYGNGSGYYGNGSGYYGNGSGYYGNGSGYYGNGSGYYSNGAGYYGNGTGFYSGAPAVTNASIAASGFTIPPTQIASGLQPQVQGSASANPQAMIWDPTLGQWRLNAAVRNSTDATTSYYQPAQASPAPTYYYRGRRR